jgi:hypothetical protein
VLVIKVIRERLNRILVRRKTSLVGVSLWRFVPENREHETCTILKNGSASLVLIPMNTERNHNLIRREGKTCIDTVIYNNAEKYYIRMCSVF